MDGENSKQEQARDVRDLTNTIRQIDINDPRRDRNETEMRTTDGRTCKFTE